MSAIPRVLRKVSVDGVTVAYEVERDTKGRVVCVEVLAGADSSSPSAAAVYLSHNLEMVVLHYYDTNDGSYLAESDAANVSYFELAEKNAVSLAQWLAATHPCWQ